MKVGDVLVVRGKDAVVVAVHPLGTVDVEIAGRYYRVTGLPLV